MNITRRTMGVSALALMGACATRTVPGSAPVGRAAIGSFGLDMSARDGTVRPGDDFFRHVSGSWLANNPIPDDRVRWGVIDILRDKSDRDVRVIVEEIAAAGGPPGSNRRKIADCYNAFLDQASINARGLAPIQRDLDAIASLQTHADAFRLATNPGVAVETPFALFMMLDPRDPNRYRVNMVHAGIGLPEREYYRRTDGQFPTIREAYVAHIERMLRLAGQADAASKARAVMALETQIAELHWPVAERRDRERVYNLRTRAELRAIAPAFPWDALLEGAGLSDVSEVVVWELSAVRPIAELCMATPIETWRAHFTFHLIRQTSPVLPQEVDDANFDFYGRTLSGQPRQLERWQRAIQTVNGTLGEAVGEIYVQRHFPPEAKAQMLQLVENMRRAYGERIDQLSWMSPETKVVARQKLAAFRPKIGYPDQWRDYSTLDVRADDAYGNWRRASEWEWERNRSRLNSPTDREEWGMTPQTVNAYYNPMFNEIVFPAAILQAPIFDPNADPAVNYGAIGGVIGHEMGHGFDDQGARSDAAGVLRQWWSDADLAAFANLVARLAAQYSEFEPLPGIRLNGQLTSGENIGDNGGLQVALHAYRLSLAGREAPVLEGTTGEQRFFMAWAQSFRANTRDEALRNQVLGGPHSPVIYRVNGTVRNMDAWYDAFNVQPSDALYLPSEKRVSIW